MSIEQEAKIVIVGVIVVISVMAIWLLVFVHNAEMDRAMEFKNTLDQCNSMNLSDDWEKGIVMDLQEKCYILQDDRIG